MEEVTLDVPQSEEDLSTTPVTKPGPLARTGLEIDDSRKVLMFKLICLRYDLPHDIYLHLCLFYYIFLSLEGVEFEWDFANPRILYNYSKSLRMKKWQISERTHGSYEKIQTLYPLSFLPQLWVVEVSRGDIWVGIARKGQSFDDGYGCWPETAFTSGCNEYTQRLSLRSRLLIYISIDLTNGRLEWELYLYPNEKDDDELPRGIIYTTPDYRLQAIHMPYNEISKSAATLKKLVSYKHEKILMEEFNPYYLSFAFHNSCEYVNVLSYGSLSQSK